MIVKGLILLIQIPSTFSRICRRGGLVGETTVTWRCIIGCQRICLTTGMSQVSLDMVEWQCHSKECSKHSNLAGELEILLTEIGSRFVTETVGSC
ncbi:hypothetical protein RDI58_005694 [Solanum bulbocastanum]|uniref:Uncharacterized protein n=1 Tax=Solanum bulbocastanum TaxID=147425 RepID=A0AAN8U8T8_SOLBU